LLFPSVVALSLASEDARADVRVYAKLATNKQIESSKRRRVNVMAPAQSYEPGRPPPRNDRG